jgi:multidrug efflux pump
MNFSELFIRRPVLSVVVSLLILLLGVQGFMGMTIRQYPEVQETVITVTTAYPGASADLIQGFITTPIAKAVSSTENVDYVTASSTQGASSIQVRMRLGSDADKALTEVISKTQQVRRFLPTDAEDSIITKGTGRSFALMYLAFASSRMKSEQITEYLSRVIQPRMSTIEGVADAQILGARNFAMRIWLDPGRMASHNITAKDISDAVNSNNFLASPGSTKSQLVAVAVDTDTTLKTPEAFAQLPIRGAGDAIVRLGDVAHIELGTDDDTVKVSFNGREGVFIGIFPTPSANPLTTAAAIRDMLPSLKTELPEGMDVIMVFDSTIFIQASIDEVFKTVGEAVAIVVLVIFLFLGSIRSVAIPVITIPLSLVGVCFVLFLMGYSINLLTMLAMVLAIGLVVDDAIVVVENIHRHIEDGERPIDAAVHGMREIFTAILAMTITLAAVYAPIGFTQGLTGALFREFAFALAGAVVISGFVAVTVSPMMAGRFLLAHENESPSSLVARIDRAFEWLAVRYSRALSAALDSRPVILMIVATIFGTLIFMFMHTKSELAPGEDQGALFALVTGPRYATSNYTKHYVDQFDAAIGPIPETNRQFSIVGFGGGASGGNSGIAVWRFVPWAERSRNATEIQQQIQGGLSKIPGVEALVFNPPSLPGTGGLPVQYVIRSVGSPDQVYDVAERLKQEAMKSGKFIVVQDSLAFDLPRAAILIDRDRAAALGVKVSDVGTTLNVLLSQSRISRFDRDNRSYDVIPQVDQQFRLDPEALGRFYVRSEDGHMVPLSALTKMETRAGPVAIEQFNQLNSATLSALPSPGVTSSEGLAAMREASAHVMPTGFFEDYAGESRLTLQEGNSLAFAFVLAVLVIYLVLAAQFESFREPFIIMMAVPLSIFGAMIPLYLGFGTLNIYTQVGLITLVGLITKHGILMVQFAKERLAAGISPRAAIEEAARVRLRPILMTTAAMVLGVMPLVIASGAGAASRHAIGLVITTGMAVGTMFTLFIVPMFYTYIAERPRRPVATEVPA